MGRWGLHDDYYRNGFISISTTIFIFQFCLLSKTFFQKEQIVALFWILKEYCFRSKIQLFVALLGKIKDTRIDLSIKFQNGQDKTHQTIALKETKQIRHFDWTYQMHNISSFRHFIYCGIRRSRGQLRKYAFSCVCSLFIILFFSSQFSHKRKCFKLSS